MTHSAKAVHPRLGQRMEKAGRECVLSVEAQYTTLAGRPAGGFVSAGKWRPRGTVYLGDMIGVEWLRFNVWALFNGETDGMMIDRHQNARFGEISDDGLCDYSPAV